MTNASARSGHAAIFRLVFGAPRGRLGNELCSGGFDVDPGLLDAIAHIVSCTPLGCWVNKDDVGFHFVRDGIGFLAIRG
jgi:hypothetical protein